MSESARGGIDPKIATGLPPGREAPDDEKAIYAVTRYAAQNDHFVGFYKTWTKAVNFLIGEHWRSKWDGTSLTWVAERDIPSWHQQPVTNLVYAVYRNAQAKLTKQKPTLEVIPPSGDSEDKEAAELSEAVLVDLWRRLKKPQKLPVAIGWLLLTGMVFLRVGWDPMAGDIRPRTVPLQRPRPNLANLPSSDEDDEEEDVDVAADEDGEPYQTADGQPDFDREPDMEPIGDICWDVISPLAVRFNPEATSIDDATEMYVGTLWPKNKAAKHFGLTEEELGAGDDSTEQRALYEDLMSATAAGFPRSWADRSSQWGVSKEDAIGNRILVVEYYGDKTDECKEGRHWITAGAKKVWPPSSKKQAAKAEKKIDVDDEDADDPFPYGEAPLPFGFWPPLVCIQDTPIPGQPTALGVIPQVVPLNEQLNTLDGKITERHIVDSMGGIWFASPEDDGLVITSEPGQVVYSKAMGRRGQAFAPYQAKLSAMPDAVYREREVITQKVMVVSSLTALDLAQKPQGVTSGRALLVTQETSDSVLLPTLIQIENGLEEGGRRELYIAQQRYSEPRTIAIEGEKGQQLYRTFMRTDLRSGHDVRVQTGSSFPWNKSAQWDTKLGLIEKLPQLVIKPDGTIDKQALARHLDAGMPGLSSFDSDEDPDLVEIQREHSQFEVYDPQNGELQLPQIAFWQNHAAHLQAHYDFMKRDYGRYARWSPAAQEAFKQHMQLTLMAIQEQVAKLMPTPQPGGEGAEGGEDGGAPAPAPAEGGAPPLALSKGSSAKPAGGPQLRLNNSDFAAARTAGGNA